MRELPSGQYIAGDSLLHRLDARTKLVGLVFFLIAALSTKAILGYVVLACVLALLIRLAQVPFGAALGSLRYSWKFLLVIFLMNAFFFSGEGAFWRLWIFSLSRQSIAQGLHVVVRVALAVVPTNLLSCTTPPMQITHALERLMRPLALLRVPVEEVAMIINIAIQFIPTLMQETDTIRQAQTARGARFESQNLRERIASTPPLIIPIFLSAFRRADDLSLAMEARGYRNAKQRTKKQALALTRTDWLAIGVCALICLAQIVLFSA